MYGIPLLQVKHLPAVLERGLVLECKVLQCISLTSCEATWASLGSGLCGKGLLLAPMRSCMLGYCSEGKSGHLGSLGIVGMLFSGVLGCLVGFLPAGIQI